MYDTKIVLIPAYKPEPALLTLLERLSCREYLTILIDDGSGDAFHEIFRAAEKYAVVLSHGEVRRTSSREVCRCHFRWASAGACLAALEQQLIVGNHACSDNSCIGAAVTHLLDIEI